MTAPFSVLAPPRILFGRGRVGDVPSIIRSFGSRLFVVHGSNDGRVARTVADLTGSGVTVYGHACPREPNLPMLDEAVDAAREFRADVVLGFGGGAAMDLAKAVAALAPGTGRALDHLEVVGKGRPLDTPPLPFVAVPTTAGTGAEATKNAVIDVPEHRRKVSLRDDRMIARVAVVDPALCDLAPRQVTLASGLDAIVQVIEPYVCNRANPYTDALARAAIPVGLEALSALMRGEDPAARDRMAWVSLCGGLALANSGLGAVHGLAGVIGGLTGAAHGAVCGALLPAVLRMNLRLAGNGLRLGEVAGWISGAHGSVEAFEAWMHDAGLPRLSTLGVDARDHMAIAVASLDASSMKANPVAPSVDDLVVVLQDAG